MSLAVCVFITWCVIIVFALIPKTLTELEMVFLIFVCTIFELSVFTVFHLNLHWVEVDKGVEMALSDLMMRLICFPLLVLISTNLLLYPSILVKWATVAATVLVGVLLQKTLEWLGILTTPHWNMGYTALLFCSYIAFSRLMTWFIKHIHPMEGSAT